MKRAGKIDKKDGNRRAKPMVPKAGFTKRRSRYAKGGRINKKSV